ncbi:MAG: hypothetical protein ACMUHX_03520 [bacterium]
MPRGGVLIWPMYALNQLKIVSHTFDGTFASDFEALVAGDIGYGVVPSHRFMRNSILIKN